MFTLIDEGAIVPFDPIVKTEEDKKWLGDFYPGFMANSQTDGKTWGIPFQRPPTVMYYNQDLLKQAGLNADYPPSPWDSLVTQRPKIPKTNNTATARSDKRPD